MESIIYVGMDVHKDTDSLCSYDPKRNLFFSEMQIKSETENVIKYLEHVSQMNDGALILCGYEAGPTGFRLCRELQKKGFACVVMAPTSIAKSSKDRLVKTDRADARMLAKALAAKQYKEVVLPTEHIESMNEPQGKPRGIVRSHKVLQSGTPPISPQAAGYVPSARIKEIVRLRVSAQKACKRAKQNLLSFLLSQGFHYPDGGSGKYWTKKFFEWLKTIKFASDYLQYCFEEYLSEVTRQIQRLSLMDRKLKELEDDKEIAEGVRKLKCICGIDTIIAVGLIAEVGDFNRFSSAEKIASYTGLCPGRHSSGLSDRGCGITRQGNRYLRKLLVEAAKSVKRSAPHGQKSKQLLARQEGCPSEIINYADKASRRIRSKMERMERRGVPYNKATAACARELVCFAWGMMTGNVA